MQHSYVVFYFFLPGYSSNIDNVILLAKGGVKKTVLFVNAKIINRLDNNRIDTTQGVNMTKSLIATELAP